MTRLKIHVRDIGEQSKRSFFSFAGFLSFGSGLLLQAAASVYTISMCHVIDSTLRSHVRDMREATADIKYQLSELRTSVNSLSGALQSGLESIRQTVKEEFQKSHQFELMTKLELLQMNLTDFLEGETISSGLHLISRLSYILCALLCLPLAHCGSET